MIHYTTSFEDVASALERRAPQRQTITYNDLAREVGLPPVNNLFTNSPLAHYFEQIDADDSMEQRPFRTALVVQKTTGRPGAGFFKSLRELRQVNPAKDDETLWTEEVHLLGEYYQTECTSLTLRITPAQSKRLEHLCSGRGTRPSALLEGTLSDHLSYIEDLFDSIDRSRSQISDQTISHEELFAEFRSKLKPKKA